MHGSVAGQFCLFEHLPNQNDNIYIHVKHSNSFPLNGLQSRQFLKRWFANERDVSAGSNAESTKCRYQQNLARPSSVHISRRSILVSSFGYINWWKYSALIRWTIQMWLIIRSFNVVIEPSDINVCSVRFSLQKVFNPSTLHNHLPLNCARHLL